MSSNPYAAPKAAVADAATASQGNFVPGGRGVPAGNGWTWIAGGWDLFMRQPWMWVLIFFVWIVGGIVLSLIPLVGLVLNFLYLVFTAGMMIGCKALDNGERLEFGHLFAGFKDRLGTLLAVAALAFVATLIIVFAVMAVVGFSVFAGAASGDPNAALDGMLKMVLAALVILALVLPIVMAVWFAPALIVFDGRGAVEAMKESFSGCLKNILPFLVYGVILLIPAIIATVPIGLGWLVLGPVLVCSAYASYRDIYFTS